MTPVHPMAYVYALFLRHLMEGPKGHAACCRPYRPADIETPEPVVEDPRPGRHARRKGGNRRAA